MLRYPLRQSSRYCRIHLSTVFVEKNQGKRGRGYEKKSIIVVQASPSDALLGHADQMVQHAVHDTPFARGQQIPQTLRHLLFWDRLF